MSRLLAQTRIPHNVLATAVGVDGLVEGDVGRLVADQCAARVLPADFRLQFRRLHRQGLIPGRPAIVKRRARILLEAVRVARGRPPPFEGLQRDLEVSHGQACPAACARAGKSRADLPTGSLE